MEDGPAQATDTGERGGPGAGGRRYATRPDCLPLLSAATIESALDRLERATDLADEAAFGSRMEAIERIETDLICVHRRPW